MKSQRICVNQFQYIQWSHNESVLISFSTINEVTTTPWESASVHSMKLQWLYVNQFQYRGWSHNPSRQWSHNDFVSISLQTQKLQWLCINHFTDTEVTTTLYQSVYKLWSHNDHVSISLQTLKSQRPCINQCTSLESQRLSQSAYRHWSHNDSVSITEPTDSEVIIRHKREKGSKTCLWQSSWKCSKPFPQRRGNMCVPLPHPHPHPFLRHHTTGIRSVVSGTDPCTESWASVLKISPWLWLVECLTG